MRADEERACLLAINPALVHQRLQCFDEVARYGHDPLLSTFAAQKYLRSGAIQLEIAGIDRERLGNARTGACQEQQQRSITTAARRALVRCIDRSVRDDA